jgi:DNA-directed RNA polymerase specialized sigma24 family protein
MSMVALSEDEFATAVKNALRDLARIEALRSSPLLRSRLVMETQSAPSGANDKARAEALQALVVKTIEALQTSPRDAKLYRALLYTYVKPAPTQEQAAERLDLPFSTYRRHLQSGISRVTEMLWQRELGG